VILEIWSLCDRKSKIIWVVLDRPYGQQVPGPRARFAPVRAHE
jgi:hypothetical protein